MTKPSLVHYALPVVFAMLAGLAGCTAEGDPGEEGSTGEVNEALRAGGCSMGQIHAQQSFCGSLCSSHGMHSIGIQYCTNNAGEGVIAPCAGCH